jgi:SAM-dependent methyltransferase
MVNKGLFFSRHDGLEDERFFDLWKSSKKVFDSKPQNYFTNLRVLEKALNLEYEGIQNNILYVGSGVAEEFFDLAQKYPNNKFYCLDINEDKIALINRLAERYSLPVFAFQGDGCSIPFKDIYFDSILSQHLMEHIWDTEITVREQIRVLKPGGRLIIIDGNFLNLKTLYDLLIKYPRRTKFKYGGIKWLFNKTSIRKNIYKLGWNGKDEDVKTIYYWRRFFRRHFKNVMTIHHITTHKAFLKKRNLIFNLVSPFYGKVLVICKKRNGLQN